MLIHARLVMALVALVIASSAHASNDLDPIECSACESWNEAVEPYALAPHTWYVGTRGLASVLIADPDGLVLIDGGLPQSVPHILANVRKLGFAPPIARWLVARADLVTSLLEQGDSYFDVREALRIRDENLRGRHEHAQFLFCLTSLGAHAEARGRFVRGLEPCTSSAS